MCCPSRQTGDCRPLAGWVSTYSPCSASATACTHPLWSRLLRCSLSICTRILDWQSQHDPCFRFHHELLNWLAFRLHFRFWWRHLMVVIGPRSLTSNQTEAATICHSFSWRLSRCRRTFAFGMWIFCAPTCLSLCYRRGWRRLGWSRACSSWQRGRDRWGSRTHGSSPGQVLWACCRYHGTGRKEVRCFRLRDGLVCSENLASRSQEAPAPRNCRDPSCPEMVEYPSFSLSLVSFLAWIMTITSCTLHNSLYSRIISD